MSVGISEYPIGEQLPGGGSPGGGFGARPGGGANLVFEIPPGEPPGGGPPPAVNEVVPFQRPPATPRNNLPSPATAPVEQPVTNPSQPPAPAPQPPAVSFPPLPPAQPIVQPPAQPIVQTPPSDQASFGFKDFDSIIPPSHEFYGGQDFDSYYNVTFHDYQTYVGDKNQYNVVQFDDVITIYRIKGRIIGIRLDKTTDPSHHRYYLQSIDRQGNITETLLISFNTGYYKEFVRIENIVRTDGQPDTSGFPPGGEAKPLAPTAGPPPPLTVPKDPDTRPPLTEPDPPPPGIYPNPDDPDNPFIIPHIDPPDPDEDNPPSPQPPAPDEDDPPAPIVLPPAPKPPAPQPPAPQPTPQPTPDNPPAPQPTPDNPPAPQPTPDNPPAPIVLPPAQPTPLETPKPQPAPFPIPAPPAPVPIVTPIVLPQTAPVLTPPAPVIILPAPPTDPQPPTDPPTETQTETGGGGGDKKPPAIGAPPADPPDPPPPGGSPGGGDKPPKPPATGTPDPQPPAPDKPPATGTPPKDPVKPPPKDPPPDPDDPCNDPCLKDIRDKIKDIQDKLKPKEDECTYDTIYLPYVTCEKTGDTHKSTLKLQKFEVKPNSVSSEVIQFFASSAQLAMKGCESEDECCIAAVPDWWQVRLGADRPQLVLQFAEILEFGKYGPPHYVMTIPHPTITNPPRSSPISPYDKGNIEGILTLSDNSKFIVNAASPAVAEGVIAQAKRIINPQFLQGSFVKIGERKGQNLAEVSVRAKIAKYFPTGQQNLKPQWVKYFV